MAFSVTTNAGFIEGDPPLTASKEVTGGSVTKIDESISIANDVLVAFVLDYSQCKVLMMLSDQDLTVETNANDASGGQTIALKAGIPLFWQQNSGITCPITTDISALYVTNASAAAARLQIRALVDPTV